LPATFGEIMGVCASVFVLTVHSYLLDVDTMGQWGPGTNELKGMAIMLCIQDIDPRAW